MEIFNLQNKNDFDLIVLFAEKAGVCPAVVDGAVGLCGEFCSNDYNCTGTEKCCSNGCGHICVEAEPGINKSLTVFERYIKTNFQG